MKGKQYKEKQIKEEKHKEKQQKEKRMTGVSYRRTADRFMRKLKLRRNYKDRLFVRIFSDKEELLSLYNALNGSSYTDSSMITVTTLEDNLYISVKNDCSFIIGMVLNLYEHQSTLNPNMPVRGLEYFADIYRAYIQVNGLDLYHSPVVKLPSPRYVIFYNGEEPAEDRFELRLSDAFEDGKGCLECVATVININWGHNEEVMKKCRTLMEYSRFIAKVREGIQEGQEYGEAVDRAIVYCIEHDILKAYLLKHRSEVVRMFETDYSMKAFARMKDRNIKRLEHEVAVKEAELADKDEEIAYLRKLLAEYDNSGNGETAKKESVKQ